ncbi:hypothetical protein [Bradyrhizobium manausense]|uniref:hypothetical protein n=1 Tax=Bradyrhizobium manausense TaxID=989370 RepID=UPI001BAB0E48|nr:hypothetical protein [Bradyrhizobium manausense]MBR0721786.1 hypothetical protein [Bradyrhizobium manausense]
MANKVKRTISISAESDYEIHRLAKLWGVKVTKARERCYHYVAARLGNFQPGSTYIKDEAALRQAEAKVEMLKAPQRNCSAA